MFEASALLAFTLTQRVAYLGLLLEVHLGFVSEFISYFWTE